MNKKRGNSVIMYTTFIVFAVAVAALVIFAIKNPDAIKPDKCDIQLGLYCKDKKVFLDEKMILLKLQNSLEKPIIVESVSVTGEGVTDCIANSSFMPFAQDYGERKGWKFEDSEEANVKIYCKSMDKNLKKLNAEIIIKWSNEESNDIFVHTARGTLRSGISESTGECCCSLPNSKNNNDLTINAWADEKKCMEKLGGKCNEYQYLSCPRVEKKCCILNGNYLWGPNNCFGNETGVAENRFCQN